MLKFVLVTAAAYGLIVAFVYATQGRMLYLPEIPGRNLDATPHAIGLEYEDVWIETDDGVAIHGWFVPAPGNDVLLFFHGNAGNISHRLGSIQQFHGLGQSVFIIDYRGYGQSGGKPKEPGMYLDADAAWRYLTNTRGVRSSDIVVFGRSLGASVAAKLASRHQPRALIIESSFTSVPDIAQELYPWLPARWLTRLRHATRDYVRDVNCPVLVVHSRDDDIIPYHHGESIFDAAREPRAFLEIRGTHNDAIIRDERNYLAGLRDFLGGLEYAQ